MYISCSIPMTQLDNVVSNWKPSIRKKKNVLITPQGKVFDRNSLQISVWTVRGSDGDHLVKIGLLFKQGVLSETSHNSIEGNKEL